MHNWKILEGSKRLGGRVYTNYFNGTKPEDYQYQEMGGMRIPVSIKYAGTNETLQIQDHQMVFNLAEALNVMNGNDSSLEIKFVPWIQSSANDPALTSKRRPDGTIPGDAEVKANHSLADSGTATYSNATAVTAARTSFVQWVKLKERMADIATNVFRAHKKAIQDGLFDYSEAMYLRDALNVNVNIADQAVTSGSADFVPSWPYESVYFAATEWKTIDKGLSKLPAAFGPLVSNRTSLGVKVQELSWDEDRRKIRAHWRPKDPFTIESESEEYDYAIVSVPFTRVRLWKLPAYSPLMLRAINTMNYRAACKVALQYKTHFWEKLPQPIFGGCGEVNIPAVGSICYPSYQINSSLPGILLGSYVKGAMARAVGSLSEMDHVALVQRAMIETHGIIAQEQYTGAFDRVCWEQEELSGGAWCDPVVGQQELFLPAYYQTDKNTIFVGEHTSFTHGWIFSALESAVRGTVQLLLDMGLVDEAKQVTNTWMARWLKM
jgi:monoamine oxidase